MTTHWPSRSNGQPQRLSNVYRDEDEDGAQRAPDYEADLPLAAWKYNRSDDEISRCSGDENGPVSPFFTREEEQDVVSKLDKRLVLFVALLYLLSFLDRSNIGNAKAAGMETDLDLTESQFHWILEGFYITYILFEFMTISYRIFPAHIYISICAFAMGTIAALQSLSTGFWSMIILRLCLGTAEAAFGPGIPFYLSFFFKREELARRTGLFIAAAPLANSFSGSLAWLILRFADHSSIDGWRLLFIAEGFPNVVLAVLAWYIVPDSPGTAPWLNGRERRIAAARLQNSQKAQKQDPASRNTARETPRKSLELSKIWTTLKDPKSYIVAAILFSLNVAFSSLPVFLPTIVANMGFSALSAQGMSAFPNLSAFAIVLATASASDRFGSRSIPLIAHALLAMTGYGLLALAPRMPHFLRYLCLFPITAGFFSAVTMVLVWTINNQESDEGKAVGSSIIQVFGHIGSILGQQLYPDSGAPYYVGSHAICACFMALAAALAFVLRTVLDNANRRRAAAAGLHQNIDEEDESFVADRMVNRSLNEFLYIL